ncbi:glycosyltransferase family 4 protein [bacterium]|nr:glycosyltransferase family 4 protein [bacterium]
MKVMFIMDSPQAYMSGIWLHRNEIPSESLRKRGHAIKQVAIGHTFPDDLLNWPDTVIFGRTYPSQFDPIKTMTEFKKKGKRVLYDMDDDFWSVAKDNPSVLVSNALKDQYEGMIREADAVITPSTVLAKKFKRYFKKPVFICPNGIDERIYQERPHQNTDTLKIGYMGAASHWKDLQLIGEVISELYKKHDFLFTIYGLTGEPLEAAIYTYNKIYRNNFQPERNAYFKSALDFYEQISSSRMWHVPFMPPELHPKTLSMCDLDIGLAPLEDTEFNRGKSCIKFYEYASVGTVTLASDVLPYSDEVGYLAKNTKKDWYNKLEKLIIDHDFRNKLLTKQQKWVRENRYLDAIGVPWELACQRPGGVKVLNQTRNEEKT